jgi:hypothetical protein
MPTQLTVLTSASVQIAFQVNDRILPTAIGEVRVIPEVKQVEHDRSWAKVERHTITHTKANMALER